MMFASRRHENECGPQPSSMLHITTGDEDNAFGINTDQHPALKAAKALDKLKVDGDAQFGVDLMKSVVQKPVRTIADNAGIDGAIVARRVLRDKSATFGFNALKKDYGDMIAAGVVDPTKVTRSALQNAVSIAGLLLTTDCVITDMPEGDDDAAGTNGEM